MDNRPPDWWAADGAPAPTSARRSGLKIAALAALGSAVPGALSFGVPGVLLIWASRPLMRLIGDLSGLELHTLRWDWWLVSMKVTVAWPLALVAAYAAASWAGLRGWVFGMAMAAGMAAGALAITILVWAGATGWLG